MTTAVVLRVVLKVARLVFEAYLEADRSGGDTRKAFILELVKKRLAARERRAMRELYDDGLFLQGVGQIIDGIRSIRMAVAIKSGPKT